MSPSGHNAFMYSQLRVIMINCSVFFYNCLFLSGFLVSLNCLYYESLQKYAFHFVFDLELFQVNHQETKLDL